MPNVKSLQRSFGGGEISAEMFGRLDDAKYQSGAAKLRNFIAKPQGAAENRPGFQFVRAVKDSTKRTRLIPFTFSTTQTMVIELGAGYFRFHTQGATVLSGASPYEISNPYAEGELFDIHYVQSADVLTLVHPNHAPRELRRLGATNWTLSTINFASPISAPSAPTVVASGHTAVKYTYYYVVTSVAADGVSESSASTAGSDGGNLFETGGICTISWGAVSGASRYNVYKQQGGLYGYIGQTTGTSIVDENIAPDMSKTPPLYDTPFSKAGSISAVAVTTGGSGYSSVQSGGAITAVALPVGSDGMVSIPIQTSDATLTVSDPTGTGATFAVTVVPNDGGLATIYPFKISGVSVLTQGSGYTKPVFVVKNGRGTVVNTKVTPTISEITTSAPVINVNDTTGTGAVLTATVSGGAITAINVVNGGSGYTAPTVTITAPVGTGATLGAVTLASSGDYPASASYFEQRRCFAGTTFQPQTIWMTRSGTESDMSYTLPTRDEDRIKFRVAAREANTIRHIVPLSQLLLLTSAAEWRVASVNSDAITPTSISVKPQSYVGASNVQPVIINNTLLYGAARGGHVRECAYNWQANGFITGDLSLRAAHLFDGLDVVDMAYSKAPQPLVWFVSSNGKLLGLTYVPEQQVGAWHQHDTDGNFLSCCVVAEDAEDVLYVIVARSVNGSYVQYIERMASRQFADQTEAFFVDSGLTYRGAAADVISGLSHLEGKVVSILADGAVHPTRTVTGGEITLDNEASVVHVGLPYDCDIHTLPLALQVDGAFGQGRTKNVNKVWLRVFRSGGIFAGPSETRLTEAKQRTTEIYGVPPALKSEEIPITITPSWGDSGQVYIRQSDPLPLTIVNLTVEVAVGG